MTLEDCVKTPKVAKDPTGGFWACIGHPRTEGFPMSQSSIEYKQIPILVKDFCCPICGAGEYSAEYKTVESQPGTIIGSTNHCIMRYKCKGCTALFTSPTAFTSEKSPVTVNPELGMIFSDGRNGNLDEAIKEILKRYLNE